MTRKRHATTRNVPIVCFCSGRDCDGTSRWLVRNNETLSGPLHTSDECLSNAIRRAGLPALIEEPAEWPR